MGKSSIIKWDIMKKAQAYKGGNNSCRLCLEEKLCILEHTENKLLNKRSELTSKCRHIDKFLVSFTTWLISYLFSALMSYIFIPLLPLCLVYTYILRHNYPHHIINMIDKPLFSHFHLMIVHIICNFNSQTASVHS